MEPQRRTAPVGPQVPVLTRDAELVRWVQASAVGSGAGVHALTPEEADAGAVRGRWREAPVVLVGADAVPDLLADGAPGHRGLHLLAGPDVDAAVLRAAVRLGVRSVLDPAHGTAQVAALLAAVADPRPPGAVLGVASGSGGAGASVLAAAVALLGARQGSVALVLTDPSAAEASLVLGGEPTAGLTWAGLSVGAGTLGPVALREALPCHAGVHVLGFDRGEAPPTPAVVRTILDAARAAFDLVVVDVDLRDAALLDVVRSRSGHLWTVARPGVCALATARNRREQARVDGPVLVRGDALPAVAVEVALATTQVHVMAEERRLDEWLDVGAGPVARRRSPLRAAAARVLADSLSGGAR